MKKPQTGQRIAVFISLAAGLGALAGCAGLGGLSAQPHYRCENGMEFKVRFVDDTAVLESKRGEDVLLRDAGGQGAAQTVFSNSRLRAEFGLGDSGRDAVLHFAQPPAAARCQRD